MTSSTITKIVWGTGPVLILAGAIAWAQAASPAVDRVKRGEYLVNTSGCHDCHTPWKMGPGGPEPDMSRMLSGHPETISVVDAPRLSEPWTSASIGSNTAFAGPWGISYTMNLTPDRNTGLGIWTEDMFIKAIRTGRHMGVSRPINPPMPWTVYRNWTDEDVKAVYAYLRTIPPVVNHIPDYVPPTPSVTVTSEVR